MKKFAIGCAIVLVLLLVVGGIAGYFVYQRFVGPIATFATNMQQVAEIEKEVKNTSSFTAPENGELTEEMVSRFVKVQAHMQSKLGKRTEELKTTYDKLDKTLNAEKRQASFTEAMGALRDLATLLVDTKKAQVEALNQAGFSVSEYEWVRAQVYAAVGVVAGGFDLKKMAEQAKAGNVEGLSGGDKESLPDVPEKNQELVRPYEKQLKEWAPFAFFGF
jgi:vacuolar-type H+-ATPase subunit I/STV1